ncbi:MAG TPA: histidine kinase, partial [Arachidicoccus sp.]
MRKKLSTFWVFQFGGWLGYFVSLMLTNLSNILSIALSEAEKFFALQFAEMLEGIALTAFLRSIIIRSNILQKKFLQQIWFLFLSALCISFILSLINVETEKMLPLQVNDKYGEHPLWTSWASNFFIILVWNLFYFSYHYVVRSNRERLDKARLESLVKDLELKTIKAHINPHFIFNALNSIRYLVDEDPNRARNAITQLSILLRSSMHAEDASTTPLENELEIVQSYLDLEKLRFEERLHIFMNIDNRTRELQVPPMMLQTLVENAIKHGISKQIDGGDVT